MLNFVVFFGLCQQQFSPHDTVSVSVSGAAIASSGDVNNSDVREQQQPRRQWHKEWFWDCPKPAACVAAAAMKATVHSAIGSAICAAIASSSDIGQRL